MTESEIRQAQAANAKAMYLHSLRKYIECPVHPHSEGHRHSAVLYTYPHPDAGTWECFVDDVTDAHDHYESADAGKSEIVVEDIEVDTMRNGEHDTYASSVYVCGGEEGCGITLEGDPAADRYEDSMDRDED